MKVKDLIAMLEKCDPEGIVLVSGFETMHSNFVAEADMVRQCKTVPCPPKKMDGDRKLSTTGEPSTWIGWSGDYRADSQLTAIENPSEYESENDE